MIYRLGSKGCGFLGGATITTRTPSMFLHSQPHLRQVNTSVFVLKTLFCAWHEGQVVTAKSASSTELHSLIGTKLVVVTDRTPINNKIINFFIKTSYFNEYYGKDKENSNKLQAFRQKNK